MTQWLESCNAELTLNDMLDDPIVCELTPPPPGTTDEKLLDRDDGFLSAPEIATLNMVRAYD